MEDRLRGGSDDDVDDSGGGGGDAADDEPLRGDVVCEGEPA